MEGISDILQCDSGQAVDPFYISQDSFFDHLVSTLQRLDIFHDLFLVFNSNEFVPTNHCLISCMSPVIGNIPKCHRSTAYFLIRDCEPTSVKNVISLIYQTKIRVPRLEVENTNRVQEALGLTIADECFEQNGNLYFSMSHLQKRHILQKLWQDRHTTYDLRILTKDETEIYAHWAILAAASEKLYTLFQAPVATRASLIALLEFDAEDVELLLQFCYLGDVQIPRSKATNICKLAEILGIKNLFHTIAELGFNKERPKIFKQGLTKLSCFEQKETTKRLHLKALFEKETLSDLQLISNNHTFKLHGTILSVSPYFQKIFTQPDWRHCLIFFSDFALETVQAFVDLIYYGEVIYQGGVQDFISVMEGLIDFSLLPINSVEDLSPAPANKLETAEPELPQLQSVEESMILLPPKPPLTYHCSLCRQIFFSRKRLKTHINHDHPQSRPACEQCGQYFESLSLLRAHSKQANHRSSAPADDFFCPHCGKTFSQSSSLRKHMKVHDANQMFECDICHRTCFRKDYLEEHMRTHTGCKPYKCHACGKRFVGKTGLNHHKKTHGPPRKESVCEVCGKEFTRKALWTHMKTHNKQFQCSVCNQLFATSGTLNNHKARKHFDLKQHVCDLCPKAYSLKGELNKHKKLIHANVSVTKENDNTHDDVIDKM